MIEADKRHAVFLLHQEGMSLSEVARGFGISRQLVQRLAKENHLVP